MFGARGARRLGVAGLAVVAARRRCQRKAGLGQRGLHFLRQRNAVLAAGGVVDHDRMQAVGAGLVGVIEDQGRAELADRRRAEALVARHFQHGFLVQIVAAEMLVDIAQHRIDFEERRDGAVGVRDGIAGVDRVAEVAGIAEVVAGRHRRGVGRGEGREQRVRVPEIDALVADLGHRRRGLRRHDPAAQAVRHEQDEIVGRVVLRERRCRQTATVRPADNSTIARRIKISPEKANSGSYSRCLCLVFLYDRIVTSVPACQIAGWTPPQGCK